MFHSKNLCLNGLILDGSEPIHPIVLEYLTRIGAIVKQENGYITISGNYRLPNQIELFAELKDLSIKLHNDIVYDLEYKIERNGIINMKVINKQPREKPTAEEYSWIVEELVELFKDTGATVKLTSNNEIKVIINDAAQDDLFKNLSMEEIKEIVKDSMHRYVDFTYTGDFDLPKISYSHPESVLGSVYGFFSSYYNWLVGDSSTNVVEKADNTATAKPSPK